MAKRFTDSNIWIDKPWFIELTPAEKCAFMFIKDRCDNVGVWVPNFKLAENIIGEPIDWDNLPEKVNGNIIILENGKWWLHDMCDFQYGNLSEDCIPHKSYIALLKKHGLFSRVPEGYTKGSNTPKEKDKEKDKEKELKGKKKEPAKPAPVLKISENRHIYHLIQEAFVSKNQDKDFNYKREGPHILQLEQKALARASPEDFIKKVIVVFWQLVHSDHKLFKKKPFLPSILNSGGLWPYVMTELEDREEQIDPDLLEITRRIFSYDSK